jgi:hypothetical protein
MLEDEYKAMLVQTLARDVIILAMLWLSGGCVDIADPLWLAVIDQKYIVAKMRIVQASFG